MIIDTLIFDRSQADVDRANELNGKVYAGWDSMSAAEKAEWLAGMKGAYNAKDANRVGEAVEYVAGELAALPALVNAYRQEKEVYYNQALVAPYDPALIVVSPKKDWTVEGFMPASAAASYLADIELLRRQLPLSADCPETPRTMRYMSFHEANAIEQILFEVYHAQIQLKNKILAAIDSAAGQGVIWKKYTCVWNDFEIQVAAETEWQRQSEITSETGDLKGIGYTSYTKQYNGAQFVYVGAGNQVTVTSGTVYRVDRTTIYRDYLYFDSQGVQHWQIDKRTISTVTRVERRYSRGSYIRDISTTGYAYPDAENELVTVVKVAYGEPLEIVKYGDDYYYYVRQPQEVTT